MHTFRLNIKKLSLWIIFLSQLLIITSYFYFQGDKSNNSENIKFIEKNVKDTPNDKFDTYQFSNTKFITLKDISTNTSFIDFNSSICYRNGTDLNLMKTKKSNWECHCLPGWHGNDCGQQEVLWRAFLTYRKPVKLKGPRAFERRIIYVFESDRFNEHLVDIRVNELQDVVDLFILLFSDYNYKKLSYDLKRYLNKILFLPKNCDWKKYVKNLRSDDAILTSDMNAIPSKNAISFMKFYDNWPQPIQFRMRYSVFGFFWFHPNKTKISGGAATAAFLRDNFDSRLHALIGNGKKLAKGLILGDLNHFGGWYCEHCRESTATVEFLRLNKNSDVINWNAIATDKIDTTFIEELIENGLYLDSKTELKRVHRYHDKYFAPSYVTDNNWKFDFLLSNLYSKMDYYEG